MAALIPARSSELAYQPGGLCLARASAALPPAQALAGHGAGWLGGAGFCRELKVLGRGGHRNIGWLHSPRRPRGVCVCRGDGGEQDPHLSTHQSVVSAALGLWGDGAGKEAVSHWRAPGGPLGSPSQGGPPKTPRLTGGRTSLGRLGR